MRPTDGSVVRDVRRGDREAFGSLVETHQGRLFGLALMMVRARHGAEEVTQDAFVRAYVHLDRYDESRPFYPWLATIAVRIAQNWLRQHGRTIRHEGTALDDTPEPGTAPRALSGLIADERRDALWRAVSALPSGERTALMLFYRDDMSVGEIATALGVTGGTVKTLLFRGRCHLRERFDVARRSDTWRTI